MNEIKLTGPVRITTILESLVMVGAGVVIAAWLIGKPLFYASDAPVMSIFTAFSLLLMTTVRLARRFLFAWPMPLSLAILGMVLGGNLSSLLMQTSVPASLMKSFPDIVLTSVMTSVGLILFCLYELLIVLRNTPQSALIVDDILLHLALVPGGLSLLGHLLGNPTYVSAGTDARVGIGPLEMFFMAGYATSAVVSNRELFLWQFLSRGWANRAIFAGLFVNQFVAPIVVALIFRGAGTGAGIEVFVMLAGVITTVAFLLVQAYLHRRPSVGADDETSPDYPPV